MQPQHGALRAEVGERCAHVVGLDEAVDAEGGGKDVGDVFPEIGNGGAWPTDARDKEQGYAGEDHEKDDRFAVLENRNQG